jgi:hypothetical protein
VAPSVLNHRIPPPHTPLPQLDPRFAEQAASNERGGGALDDATEDDAAAGCAAAVGALARKNRTDLRGQGWAGFVRTKVCVFIAPGLWS